MSNDIGRGVHDCAARLGILALCALGAAAIEPGPSEPPVLNESWEAVRTPERVILTWPERSRDTALALIDKYGEPTSFDDVSLIWHRNGPWEDTVVYRGTPRSGKRRLEPDILEQSIVYAVPEKKIAELKRFDGRLEIDGPSGELSARSESETLNFLALNLADEIVAGKRTADQARDFYRKTASLSASGKTSAYMERLLFPQR